jgi:hypothetical protein
MDVTTVRIVCAALLTVWLLPACTSQWKVHGGPRECMQMCKDWGMELTGMVGVGDQGRASGGASACVCELPRSSGGNVGAAGTSASTSAAIVALQQQQAQTASQMQSH